MDNQTPPSHDTPHNGTVRNDILVALFKSNKIREILDGARDDAKKKKQTPRPQ